MHEPFVVTYRTIAGGLEQNVAAGQTGGVVDAYKLGQLGAAGTYPLGMMPPELKPNVNVFKTTEDLAAGAFVTFVTTVANGVATTTIKNAVATSQATRAFAHVRQAAAANTNATIFLLPDKNDSVALEVSKLGDQWLSATTAGACTNVPPTGAGTICQYLGYAVSPTVVHTVNSPAVTQA